jgi:neutral ceramidase
MATTSESNQFLAGFGRASITTYDPAMCMFGWASEHNKACMVAGPLYARALVIEDQASKKRVAYVCCDLGMIAESLREHVVARLGELTEGLGEHEIMLTATHTHSGPSGFSTYLFYALAGPGFSRAVHDGIVEGIVAAIMQAVESLVPASLFVHRARIPVSEPIAFNRAIASYNRNDHTAPVDHEHRDEAVDREMTVLRVDRAEGEPLGLVSWFGLHGTCIHRDHAMIHPDHKGEAALRLEAEQAAAGNPDYVAIFAQTTPADVTPNYRWSAARGFAIGRYDDDLESAAFVGEVQARYAKAIAAAAPTQGQRVLGRLAGAIRYVDFFAAPVAPVHALGRVGLRTAPPVVGWNFTAGTDEGPGPFHAMPAVTPVLHRMHRAGARLLGVWNEDAEHHGGKFPFWELGRGRVGRILGLVSADSSLVGLIPFEHFVYYRHAVAESFAAWLPWLPRYLPAQLLELGPLVIAGLPVEPTVVSGRRLQQALARALGDDPHRHMVINGYANAHAGYLTTPEEYDVQAYEGACTMYGRWSLPAWCTAFDDLVGAMRAEPPFASFGSRPERHPLERRLPHASAHGVVRQGPSTDLRRRSHALPERPRGAWGPGRPVFGRWLAQWTKRSRPAQ